MTGAEILDQIRALPTRERRELVSQIWDEFADSELDVTPAQGAELDRRLEDHKRGPNVVIPWSEIRAVNESKHGRGP